MNLSNTWVDWSQLPLSSVGTLGGNDFAVWSTSSDSQTLKMFDSSTSSYANINSSTLTITMYNPIPLKVSTIKISQQTSYPLGNYSVKASNTNGNYTTLTSGSSTSATDYLSVNASTGYKYYQLTGSHGGGFCIYNIELIAQYQTGAANSVVFPLSFSNTYYSFSISYMNGNSGTAYIDNKTTTGMSITNGSGNIGQWICIGY